MKILILGGTGYLGSRIIKKLLSKGNEVVCLIRNSSSKDRLIDIQKDISFVNCEESNIKQFLKTGNMIDYVINASCSYHVSGKSTLDIIKSNLFVPLELLNLSVDAGVPNFISIGTGLPDDLNIYTMSKSQLNAYGRYFSSINREDDKSKPIRFINFELENYYGPNEPLNRFIPSCIWNMKQGNDILLTEGLQHRDYIYIDDVVDAIMHIIISKPLFPNYINVPLGSGFAPSVKEIVEFLANELSSKSQLKFGAVAMRKNEPDCVADLSILHSTGFKIKYDWKSGFRKLLEESI